jgi:hypothetical protein
MKITEDGWSIIFVSIVIGIIALNMLSLHWIHLWISIGAIIGAYILLSPLFGKPENKEIDDLYSEYLTLCEEIQLIKNKKKKSAKIKQQ